MSYLVRTNWTGAELPELRDAKYTPAGKAGGTRNEVEDGSPLPQGRGNEETRRPVASRMSSLVPAGGGALNVNLTCLRAGLWTDRSAVGGRRLAVGGSETPT